MLGGGSYVRTNGRMPFDPKLHNACPDGFQVAHKREAPYNDELTRLQTEYHAVRPSLGMYGVTFSDMIASMDTLYKTKRTWLGRKPERQDARLTLLLDNAFSGYERTESQQLAATVGSSIDPEKKEVARQLAQGMTEKFKSLGWQCAVGATGDITIRVGADCVNPVAEFTKIVQELRALETAYERGERPLGDIQPPSGQVKVNPRLQPRESREVPAVTEGEEPSSGAKWQQRTQAGLTDGIAALAEKYFPEGTAVTHSQHSLFKDALREYLSRGK